MKNFPFFAFTIFTILCSIFSPDARASSPIFPSEKSTLFSSLYSEDCIDITLESDFKNLIKNKKTNLYQEGWISYTTKDGVKTRRAVQLKPRGKSRRKVCDIPPMLLKFSKEELKAEGFGGGNKLKIVTHCMEENYEESQQTLLKEYLTYKLLNILTETSFRVQLVRITYQDSVNQDSSQRFGFIIEGEDELSQRLNSSSIEKRNLPLQELEPDQYNTVALFQYMISNTDWKLPFLHNIKVFNTGDTSNLVVVPYDFDCSGLVNAPYAAINPDFGQENLRERIFLGEFSDKAALKKTLDLFRSRKNEMLLYCQNFEQLNNRNRLDIETYIKIFYKDIESKRFVKKEFMRKRPYFPGY